MITSKPCIDIVSDPKVKVNRKYLIDSIKKKMESMKIKSLITDRSQVSVLLDKSKNQNTSLIKQTSKLESVSQRNLLAHKKQQTYKSYLQKPITTRAPSAQNKSALVKKPVPQITERYIPKTYKSII